MSDDRYVEVVHRFAQIPEDLIYDTEVPAEAVRVYAVLIRHGQDPENCYPSYERIGSLIGRSARSIPSWVRALEEAGWIERVPRKSPAGDHTHNGYRVFGVKTLPGDRAVQREVRANQRGGVRANQRGGSALASAHNDSQGNDSHLERYVSRDEPLFDVPSAPPPPPDPLAGFDEFWGVYPRKVAKGGARKAWPAAVRAAGGTEPIMVGARRYATERRGEDPRYTAHPATWLRQQRWDDEQPQPGSSRPPGRDPNEGLDQDRDAPSGRIRFV